MGEEITQPLPNEDLRLILTRLDSINARLDSMESRLDSIGARLDSMDARLTTLEERVDRHLQETRPIWEQVLARLDTLETEMRTGFRRVERQIDILNRNILNVQTDQSELDERMTKLESEPSQ